MSPIDPGEPPPDLNPGGTGGTGMGGGTVSLTATARGAAAVAVGGGLAMGAWAVVGLAAVAVGGGVATEVLG